MVGRGRKLQRTHPTESERGDFKAWAGKLKRILSMFEGKIGRSDE